MIGCFENAVKYHYMKENYDIESLFSKFFVMEALKIPFPLNRVYLKGVKYLFEQLKDLKALPGFIEKCLNLLWFICKNINQEEAKTDPKHSRRSEKNNTKTIQHTLGILPD